MESPTHSTGIDEIQHLEALRLSSQRLYIACPICERDNSRLRFEVKGYKLVECTGCGLVYVNPRRTDVFSIYSDQYFADENYYINYEASRKAYRKGFRSKLKVLREVVGKGNLLDVGCAFGDFMDESTSFGFTPHGVELAPHAAQIASATGPVYCGDWLAYESHSVFDVVCFIDSLEHFENPVHAIRKAGKVLRKDGYLGIMVPNIGSWFARLSGPRWHLILPEEHLFYFNRESMHRLLRQEGFQAVYEATSGYGRSLSDILAVLLRGTGLGARLSRSPLNKIAFEINLGDLFVIAKQVEKAGQT